MKLEIEILEEQYEFIKKEPSTFVGMKYPLLMSDICECIKNGTPLPKEHVRLIGETEQKKEEIRQKMKSKYSDI